jgi:hypothetical protein
MLMQKDFLLYFTSKQLCDKNFGKSTYEKEMSVILHVVDMRHTYLMGLHFQIKIDHHNLKCFLE